MKYTMNYNIYFEIVKLRYSIHFIYIYIYMHMCMRATLCLGFALNRHLCIFLFRINKITILE